MSASILRILQSQIPSYKQIAFCPPLYGSLRRCASSYSQVGVRSNDSYVQDEGSRVEIKFARWPHSLHLPHIWLRDHCRCPSCYNAKTNQRLVDITSISNDIRPCDVQLENELLNIVWPDGHKSQYPLQFLWQNSYEGYKSSFKTAKKTWGNHDFPGTSKVTITKEDLFKGDEGVRRLIETIHKYGVGFVNNVGSDLMSTREVVEAVAPLLKSFYGEMWAFTDDNEYADLAYSREPLGAHTDTIYFNEGARLQIFHCFQPSEVGGETLLVDGFKIVEKLKDKHPEAFDFFSQYSVSGEFIGDGQHLHNIHKVINLHPITGAVQQFRYNLYDRAPVNTLNLSLLEDYYRHLKTISSLVTHPSNEAWVKLMPGSVLFVDNWRVMHGRAGYSGSRIMAGCYVANDGYRSKARTLGMEV